MTASPARTAANRITGLEVTIATTASTEEHNEIEAEIRHMTSPFLTAEAFGVEDMIDPRETRPYLCSFLEAAQVGMKTRVGLRARTGVRP